MIDPQHTYGAVFLYAAYAKGMVMEYEEKDKESGDRTIMQVTDINLNQSHTISTRAYPVVGVQKDKEEPGDEGTTEDKEE